MTARTNAILAIAAATGIVVGLVVAGFERLTAELLLDSLLEQPLAVQAGAPFLGLVITATVLRWGAGRGGTSAATSDEFISNFHESHRRLKLGPLPARMVGGIATVGLGGALGLEGPSIYAGSTIGSAIQHRLSSFFTREDAKVLMVAGAAAGVAAIFKTPATGVIFALEVPYQDDIARRALLPALMSSAMSYLTFVALLGTTPIFPVSGIQPDLQFDEMLLAIVIGLAAGIGARIFARAIGWSKSLAKSRALWMRVCAAGAVLAALVVFSDRQFGEVLTLGPGVEVLDWIANPRLSLSLIALLFLARMIATIATMSGGGVGGVFIPLAVQGLLVGRFAGGVADQPSSALYPVLGVAAFLGAGYRTPLASVMFVAESTGQARFVVPALVAAAGSQLVMGGASVSSVQKRSRSGHLERRFQLPLTAALSTDVLTVPPDATVAEFVWQHALGRRQPTVPVVDDDRYLGICSLQSLSDLPRDQWESTSVESVMITDAPVAEPTWTLRDAIAAMEKADADVIAVADSNGYFVGVVYADEILKLDEILDETQGETG